MEIVATFILFFRSKLQKCWVVNSMVTFMKLSEFRKYESLGKFERDSRVLSNNLSLYYIQF